MKALHCKLLITGIYFLAYRETSTVTHTNIKALSSLQCFKQLTEIKVRLIITEHNALFPKNNPHTTAKKRKAHWLSNANYKPISPHHSYTHIHTYDLLTQPGSSLYIGSMQIHINRLIRAAVGWGTKPISWVSTACPLRLKRNRRITSHKVIVELVGVQTEVDQHLPLSTYD